MVQHQGGTVLITGGSGYLGQFLVEEMAAAAYRVGFTHFSSAAPNLAGGSAAAFEVDLATGAGLAECLHALGPLLAVVNCAAVSSLAICERDPAAARAVNVPHQLLKGLEQHAAATGARPLLIQLSSDQVYAGTKAFWTEADTCEAVNVYGRSKLEAESVIKRQWPEHAILRSSIIYGPLSPTPVPRTLFLQFIDRALCEGNPTTFFEDEYRCPVYVNDIKVIVRTLVSGRREPLQHRVLNMGGPARLSRVDMAHAVAEAWGRSPAAIRAAPAASVSRDVAVPGDISVAIDRLTATLGTRMTAFADALRQMAPAPAGSLPHGNKFFGRRSN